MESGLGTRRHQASALATTGAEAETSVQQGGGGDERWATQRCCCYIWPSPTVMSHTAFPESSFRQLVHMHNDVTTEKILLKAKHKRALMQCMQQAE